MTVVRRFWVLSPVKLSQDGLVWVPDDQNATVDDEAAAGILMIKE